MYIHVCVYTHTHTHTQNRPTRGKYRAKVGQRLTLVQNELMVRVRWQIYIHYGEKTDLPLRAGPEAMNTPTITFEGDFLTDMT